MKIGIIRCYQTRDYCPGVLDFKAIRERSGVFADVPADEPLDIVGFIDCGGCPGKKSVLRARNLVSLGATPLFSRLHHQRHADRLSLPIRQTHAGDREKRRRRKYPHPRPHARRAWRK